MAKVPACPFLTGKDSISCSAKSVVYTPSGFQLVEYCRARRHRMCPFFCERKSGGHHVLKTGRRGTLKPPIQHEQEDAHELIHVRSAQGEPA